MAFSLGFDVGQAAYLLAVAAVGIGVGVAAWTLARLGSAMAGRTEGSFDDKLAKALRPPLSVFAGLLAAGVSIVFLRDRLDATLVSFARQALSVLFLLLAAWGIVRVLRAVLERAGERRARFQPAARLSSRLLALVVYTMAFLMVLSVFGLSITPVLTGLGIAGLAVALALQDTGANFFAGVWIQTGKALQPGHYVRLEQEKLEGYVEEVGWRVTRIRTLAGNAIVVPNNKLAQAVTTDYNLPDKSMGIGIRFRVAFEADPDHVMAVLTEEAKAAQKEDDGIAGEPFAQLADIADDANVFEVNVRVTEFVKQYRAMQNIRLRVLRRFHKEKIRIPYPTKHNLQEPVAAPPAKRKAEAPGGFAPGRRPPRPRAKKVATDPRLEEAERAKKDIEAAQREKAAEAQAGDGKAAEAATATVTQDQAKAAQAAGEAEGMPASAGEGKDGSDGGEKPANPLTRT